MGEPAGFIRSPLVEDSKTRFFVITSNNGDNVVKSVEHNVWATQRKNEQKLDEAYQCCPQVILVFSVTKSNAFQGYARMRSHTGRSSSRHDPFRGFGRLFDVEWLRLEDIDFQEVQHLRNPLNENKQLAYSRDGQELPHSVGSQLCRLIDVKVFREDPDSYEPVGLELRPLRSDSPPPSAPMLALPDHSQPPPPPQQFPHAAPMAPHGHYGHPGSPAAAPPPSYHSGGYGQPPQYAPHGHPAGPPPGYPGAAPPHAPPPGYPGAPPAYPGAPPPGFLGASAGYAGAPPVAAPPGTAPPPGYPGAPPGAPPPGYPYYPPWMYGRRRKKRRRRSPSSSSSSESAEQKKPKKKKKKDGAGEKKKKKKRNREEKPDFKNMNYEEYMAWWQKSHGTGAPPPPGQAPAARPPPAAGWPTPTDSWQGARPGIPHAHASSPAVAAVPPAPPNSPFEAAAMEGGQQTRAGSQQLPQQPLMAQAVVPPVASQAPEQTPEKAPELDQALRQSALPTTSAQIAQPAPGSPGSESSYSAISEQEAAVAALESEVNMLLQQDDEEVEAEAPPNPPEVESAKAVPAPSPAPLSIGQKLASFASTLPKLKKTLPMPLTAKDKKDGPHSNTAASNSTAEEPRQLKAASVESKASAEKVIAPPAKVPNDSQRQLVEKTSQPAELAGYVPPTSPCSSSSEGGQKNVATKPAVLSSSKVAAEAEKQVAAPSSPSSQGSEVDTAWARALSSGLDDASGDSDGEAPGPVLTDAYC